MAYKPTYDDVKKYLTPEDYGVMLKEQAKPKSNMMDIVRDANQFLDWTGAPSAAAGFLSMPQKMATNVANFPHDIGLGTPEFHLPDFMNPSANPILPQTPYAKAAETAGDLVSGLLTGGSALKYGVKAATPLLTRILRGGAMGYATSSNDQPGGRLGGAAIGTALPGAAGITKKVIGKRAAEIAANKKQELGALYEEIMGAGNKLPNAESLHIPRTLEEHNQGIEIFFKHSPSKYNSSIKRFLNEPSLVNAHKAQSDLGKIERLLEKKVKLGGHSSGELDALKEAKDLQKRIRGSMQQHFAKGERNDLGSEYENTTNRYAREVVPFKGSETEKPKDFASYLLNSDKFAKSEMASKVPGYQARRAIEKAKPHLEKYLPALALSAGAGVGIPYAILRLLEGK